MDDWDEWTIRTTNVKVGKFENVEMWAKSKLNLDGELLAIDPFSNSVLTFFICIIGC